MANRNEYVINDYARCQTQENKFDFYTFNRKHKLGIIFIYRLSIIIVPLYHVLHTGTKISKLNWHFSKLDRMNTRHSGHVLHTTYTPKHRLKLININIQFHNPFKKPFLRSIPSLFMPKRSSRYCFCIYDAFDIYI